MIAYLLVFAALVSPTPRVQTYNIERMGKPESMEYRALVDVLKRVGSDVVLLQEISGPDGEPARVSRLARDSGFKHSCVSRISGTLSGELHLAALSKNPILECTSWSAAKLSGDRRANDITRDLLHVLVNIDPDQPPWAFVTMHFKAGSRERDRFRRQIEIRRMAQLIEHLRTTYPDSPIVISGDFNEDIEDGRFGKQKWTAAPKGLPRTYSLGNDMRFPVVYDPFVTLENAGMTFYDARHEDQPAEDETRFISGRRLDYLAGDVHVEVQQTLVYDSCDDDGIDQKPAGNWLPLSESPLKCGVTGDAADHLPVIAEFSFTGTKTQDQPRPPTDENAGLLRRFMMMLFSMFP